MDVTSLLNRSTGATEQQKENSGEESSDASRISTKSRTPWDAGGYSLPMSTIRTAPSTPPHTSPDDSRSTFLPTSPRHRFSDSRSSLSSITSSLHSTTHSRFSSMSTVGSSHQLNSLAESICESLSPRSAAPLAHSLELTAHPESLRPSVSRTQSRDSTSPTESLSAHAKDAMLRRQSEASIPRIVGGSPMSAIEEKDSGIITPPIARSGSPSDAMLIRRPTLPSLRVITGEQDWVGHDDRVKSRQFLSAPLLHAKGHKRALSAPSYPAPLPPFNMPRAQAEPTPPTSGNSVSGSPVNMPMATPQPALNTAASLPSDPSNDNPPSTRDTHETVASAVAVCFFKEDCDTSSPLRKVISHIFGRNKACTRLVPSHVWVHYCRKHYQRTRYRLPREFAKYQCDLIQQQIRRIHEWSEYNRSTASGVGVVQDWQLSIRKREQARLDALKKGNSRKRGASVMEEPVMEDDEEDEEEGLSSVQSHVPSTAVPEWLLAKLGTGYSTVDILEIFNDLHTRIIDPDTEFAAFPDIEILPNISTNLGNTTPARRVSARPTATARAHKRTKSESVGAKSVFDFASPMSSRRNSQADLHHGSYAPESSSMAASRPSGLQLSLRTMRGIPEHRTGSSSLYSSSPSYGSPRRSEEYTPYYSQLAAPTPQRMNGPSMANHLEASGYAGPSSMGRRPAHTRSHSDVGAFQQRPAPYARFEGGLGQMPMYEAPRPTYTPVGSYRGAQHPYNNAYPQHAQASAHHRNHSTPVAQYQVYNSSSSASSRHGSISEEGRH